ncbi:SAF domain-containing protein [uncultured Modestobacter sp.]|uniref:SAF domain-containing protein n=1 Tax=uncultured Modestobacter sp. TaxID=380048 RepID=UPI0026328E34|nr:SAF domain-containing protein [uncultured Modestobacter sp.]
MPLPSPAPPLRSAAARRQVSRKSLVLSVLVVLLGGLVAFTAGQMLTAHTEVLAVARDVAVGSRITADDLTVASVPSDPHLSPIPATEQSRVVGAFAQVPLVRGGLLTRSQVGADSGLAAGELLVALPLKDGQFPARGLTAGQRVLIVATPGSSGAAAGGAVQPSTEATVAGVGAANPTTQVTVVDVRLREDDGPTVAQLASTGNLALILLPAGS